MFHNRYKNRYKKCFLPTVQTGGWELRHFSLPPIKRWSVLKSKGYVNKLLYTDRMQFWVKFISILKIILNFSSISDIVLRSCFIRLLIDSNIFLAFWICKYLPDIANFGTRSRLLRFERRTGCHGFRINLLG